MPFYKRKIFIIPAILLLLFGILMIPDAAEKKMSISDEVAFEWDQDETWEYLEESFVLARNLDGNLLDSMILGLQKEAEDFLFPLAGANLNPEDSAFVELEVKFFSLAPLIAARQKHRPWLLKYYRFARIWLKKQSQNWDMEDRISRNTLYRLFYGMRAAVEEVLLQSEGLEFDAAMFVEEESSATPSTNIFGIEVHSGDLLVSRGGAEASAFISRGNDYPGNFSHVAMIYIDEEEHRPYLVEAHIERGVDVASVSEYLKDTKLRFMVLRPRSDLDQLIEDPMLPQKAAKAAYDESQARHIPYDFKMNFHDSTAMFCSEVGSYAYKKKGLRLWQAESTISSPGVVEWLNTFGVENFVTQMPSDLEYDPQLTVVAEWRDPETLYKDHIDNAVMDAMWLSADQGKQIDHNPFMLPIARGLKGYCMMLNAMGTEGLIPEGMSATQALKNNSFVEKYQAIRELTLQKAEAFQTENKYLPPYWEMIILAEEAQQELNLYVDES